jgi:predicted RNA-binding protein with PUA-like domain
MSKRKAAEVGVPGCDKPSYYLMKSEPSTYGIDHLASAEGRDIWDGVRNAQARNILASMHPGDRAFFYHSIAKKDTGIVGEMEIVSEPFPDPTFISSDDNEAPEAKKAKEGKSSSNNTVEKKTVSSARKVSKPWISVMVRLVEKWEHPVPLTKLKEYADEDAPLATLQLFKQTRLSVSRVTPAQWEFIQSLRSSDIQGEK